MKKVNLMLLVFVLLTTICQAQSKMYIHQKVGETFVVPVTNIDSVTYFASVPSISTVDVSSIAIASATTGGVINSNGGEPVTARGVCWSTTQSPTISDSKTNDGSGSGSFTSNLTGLSPNKTYYVRSYATNSAGTAYGLQKSFTCLHEYLSALTLKDGETDITLTPTFVKTTDAYTATVANSVSSVTVTPTAESASATITVNGVSVESGASSSVSLSVGANSITVTVYEEGIVQQVYDISVSRTPNADITYLTVMSGSTNITLSPTFMSSIQNYTATVDYDVNTVTITPTSESSTCIITVNGTTVANGTASIPIYLSAGTVNIIPVVVNDNGNVKTYTISITRSNSAFLTNLTFKYGMISYYPTVSFSRTNFVYSVAVPRGTVNITGTLEDPNATMTINGTMVTSGTILNVALNTGLNPVNIVVTPSVGQKKTYTILITR